MVILSWILLFTALSSRLPSSTAMNFSRMMVEYNYPLSMLNLNKEQLDSSRHADQWGGPSTSTHILNNVLRVEKDIVHKIKQLRQHLHQVDDTIERYLESWSQVTSGETPLDVKYPMDGFALTRHVALSWPSLQQSLSSIKDIYDGAEWIKNQHKARGDVTEDDLSDIAQGVGRLHDVYTFNLSAVAQLRASSMLPSDMTFNSLTSSYVPSSWDLYYIGKKSQQFNILGSSVDFLSLALELVNFNSSTLSRLHPFHEQRQARHLQNLNEEYHNAVRLHDQTLERKGDRTNMHSTHAIPIDSKLRKKKKYKTKNNKMEAKKVEKKGDLNESLKRFRELCRDTDLTPPEVKWKLYCRYITNDSPLYKIGPLKMEVLSLNPYVVYIDVIMHEKETEEIINSSLPYLHSSSTKKINGETAYNTLRKSSTAWMFNHDSKLFNELDHRIAEISGSNTEWCYGGETYQVVNYGIGGYYTVHHDLIPVNMPFMRHATFLIYMSDVLQGGSTVFPWLGVNVKPKRGRALLWYNFYKDGVKDWRVEHGACPVYVGDKWIMNKWLFYGGQLHTHPCGLDPRDISDKPQK